MSINLNKSNSGNSEFQETVYDLQTRPMRNILFFTVVSENDKENNEDILYNVENELDFHSSQLYFDRVHLLGKLKTDLRR